MHGEPVVPQQRVALGTRIYRVLRAKKAKHELWMSGTCYKAGLYDLRRHQGETNQQFAARLHGELSASGAGYRVLGGLIIQEHLEDKDWTPEIAEETAQFVGELEGEDDLETIRCLMRSFLIGFFSSGMASYGSSTISSTEDPGGLEDHPDIRGSSSSTVRGAR